MSERTINMLIIEIRVNHYFRTAPGENSDGWTPIEEYDGREFNEIRLELRGWHACHSTRVRGLNAEAIRRASGCLGYALRQELAGEDLSDPEQEMNGNGLAALAFYYDLTKSRRDDPDVFAAFELARQYIVEGTPARKTDRQGAGTKGTRLVEGIGPCDVQFYLR